MATPFTVIFEGYTSIYRSTRVYGGKDCYFWHTVTKPSGETYDRFDPWTSTGGSHAPRHFYLQTIARPPGKTGT